jgi:putative mycofactocin binding protein MftB
MNLQACYRLAPGVVIRPERFGGLIYRHDTRRLYFLHSPELVEFVCELDGSRPLQEALDSFLTGRALYDTHRDAFINALANLEQLAVLDEVETLQQV